MATCLVNGKVYVGQSTLTLEKRKYNHLMSAESGHNGCPLFYRAIRKHGWDSFRWEVLVDGLDVCALDAFEMQMIEKHDAIAPAGYNLNPGGKGITRQHPDTKKKIAESSKGRVHSQETRDKISKKLKGVPQLDRRGRKRTQAVRDKMSAAKKGKTLEELSGPVKGAERRAKNAAHLAKMRNTTKFKDSLKSQKRADKLSKALAGRSLDEATKNKISEGLKLAYAEGRRKKSKKAEGG